MPATPALRMPPHPVTSYECELDACRRSENDLREALARETDLVRQRDEAIQKQLELSKEADHRLLNNLQMMASLLSLQSHRTSNAEAASQLAAAANRVATIGRVHHRLHSCDDLQTIAFREYVEDLCHDLSTLLSPEEDHPEQDIAVEGIEIDLPATKAIPLGLIVNELLTNAVKYGKGRITVRLQKNADKRYALSVSNEGPALPKSYYPTAGHGIGMTIITAFMRRIGAELEVDRGDHNKGARYTVLF